MLKYIDPLFFFIAFFIGMFLTYITTPLPTIIIKYPVPEHVSDIVYRDPSDVCYKYKVNEVMCPNDKTQIKTFDLQHAFSEKSPI